MTTDAPVGEREQRAAPNEDRKARLDSELRAALAENLVRGRAASDWGQLFLAGVTSGIFWPYVPQWVALSWLAIFLGITLAKVMGRRRWLPANLHYAATWVRIEAWLTAAMWSLWASLLVGAPEIFVVALLLLIYAGLISIGASTLVADRTAFRGFVAILLVPVTAILLALDFSRVNASTVLLIALYVPLMLYINGTAEQSLREQLLSNIKLRTSERDAAKRTSFLDALMARAPNPIVVLDRGHAVLTVNPAFERVTGHRVEDVSGKSLEALLVGAEDRAAWADLIAVLDEEARAVAEFRIRREGHEPIVVRFSAARGDMPANDNIILMGEDVTEQVRAREANEAARVAAESATQAKSAFLASMSHEVRTPLHGIMGMISILLDTRLDNEQRRTAQIVHDSADHLLTIVNDILDVSKIEAGQLSLSVETFDLHEHAMATAAMFERQAEEVGTTLETRIEDGVPRYTRGDPVRIGQILANLLSNAVKFTEGGEVRLTVDLDSRAGETAHVRFTVRDTGIGIPADQLDRVFHEFTQVAVQPGRVRRGTGLGLTIAARLARMMDGAIRLESVEGEGSVFSFVLPLPVATAPTLREVEPTANPDATPPRAAARILLAEDNAVNQLVALAILRRRGYEVDLVVDGREAVEAVARTEYDLVLMDVQMPELDGIAATREIRRERGPEALPIVALTAHAFDDERRRCLDAGMNGFLSKPFKPEELHAEVRRWLDGPRASAVSPPPKPSIPPRPARR